MSSFRRLIAPVLSALLFAPLAACESAGGTVSAARSEARRCAHCGWIESKWEIQPGVANPPSPAVYEYTVRMRDGSSSVFRETLPVSWRLGERLVLIAGRGV